jgi:hypothetical protein
VNGDDIHRSITYYCRPSTIPVSFKLSRVIRTPLFKRNTFANNLNAYDTFVHALQRTGFGKVRKTSDTDDIRGVCATGQRYTFEVFTTMARTSLEPGLRTCTKGTSHGYELLKSLAVISCSNHWVRQTHQQLSISRLYKVAPLLRYEYTVMIRAIIFDCFGVLTTDKWKEFVATLPVRASISPATDLNHALDKVVLSRKRSSLNKLVILTGRTSGAC